MAGAPLREKSFHEIVGLYVRKSGIKLSISLVDNRNGERFVRFVERVEQTMVAYGRSVKYYDIVSEHLFLRLANGLLVVTMKPKEGADPRAGQPLTGAVRRYGIGRREIAAYFLDANRDAPGDFAWVSQSRWKRNAAQQSDQCGRLLSAVGHCMGGALTARCSDSGRRSRATLAAGASALCGARVFIKYPFLGRRPDGRHTPPGGVTG
ncbi:hypothetical protein Q31a_21840 [Aureliella helgolandensis]|uniref:Uncharacterized protein n=1 Tax=Aureliella helgolandensis TaxID=2527968 RepID=A0A518G5L6_9BACT|nr:hypothetical protein Q31a_21840 [Aureliella helgolandensis]